MPNVKEPKLFRRSSRVALLAGVAAVLGSYSLPAYAQVDEIIVTARKTEESLQDVPVAVTAFTGEFFQDSGLVQFADIGKLTPNFDIQEDGVSGSSFTNLTIRGQTALNRELSSDQAVGITINGAPITRGTNLFSNLFDVDQIEVLKGPQGTLFGKNTTGGAVIVTTTAPKLGEFEAYAEADFGNFGRRDFEGVFNVPVGDNLAIRIGAASQFRDGFAFGVRRENIDTSNPELPGDTVITDDEFFDDNEVFYKASVLWEPSDQLSIRANVDYHEVDEAGQGTRVLNNGALDLSLVGVPVPPGVAFLPVAVQTPPELGIFAVSNQQFSSPFVRADEFNVNATVSYDFGGALLESITSYRDQDSLANNPFAGAAAVTVGQISDIFAQELRLSGDALDDRLQWQVGGFYATEEGIDIDNVGGTRITGSENETIAVFGQGTYAITDRLNFTGGVRYTDENRGLELVEEIAATGPLPPVPQLEASFDGISWLAGLDYEVYDDILAYATISRGFRSGGIDDESLALTLTPQNVNGVLTDIGVDDITIDPEFVLNYEIGFKADLLNNTVRWNTAGFFSDYTDIQVQTFDPVLTDASGQAIITLANGAEATIFGFESELTWAPNDNFSFGGTVGYTFAEFDEFLDTDLATGIVTDRTEEALGGPEWQLSAFGRYEHDLSESIRAGLQLNYSFRGEEELLGGVNVAPFEDPSQVFLDSFGVVNGQLDFDIDSFGQGTNIAFYAQNLLNNEFDTTGFALVAFGLDLAQRAPGAPRTYGVRLRQNF